MSLAFRILGPIEVERDGRRVEPGSPKLRVLLIDLLVHRGETLSRDRLIDDLWAGQPPATAPGVLQNYISQLRKSLGAEVVRTAGPGYAIDIEAGQLDSAAFVGLVGDARAALEMGDAEVAVKCSQSALGLWRGEALADVSFESFAQAEIARLVELRAIAVELGLEAELVAGRHQGAVARLEAELASEPLRERLWFLLMLALYRSGRQADALRAFQRARTVLTEELGIEPGAELRRLEAGILEQRPDLDRAILVSTRRHAQERRPHGQTRAPSRLVGRAHERATLEAFLKQDGGGAEMLLLVGEPGIGKTRLLEEAQAVVEDSAGLVIAARGFEAERGRPYGAWVDALRSAALPPLPEALREGLAPLLPELSTIRPDLDDPNRLYDAVVSLLVHLSEVGPTVVIFDDAHWLDAPSVALLHFALRNLQGSGVAFVASTRPAELAGSEALPPMLDELRRNNSLRELAVGPLGAASIGELTSPIAPDSNPEQITQASHGNPLLAIEMARALGRGDDPLSSRLGALIGDRLSRLGEQARSLVPWMAAFGRSFTPSSLASTRLTVRWASCSSPSPSSKPTACSKPPRTGATTSPTTSSGPRPTSASPHHDERCCTPASASRSAESPTPTTRSPPRWHVTLTPGSTASPARPPVSAPPAAACVCSPTATPSSISRWGAPTHTGSHPPNRSRWRCNSSTSSCIPGCDSANQATSAAI